MKCITLNILYAPEIDLNTSAVKAINCYVFVYAVFGRLKKILQHQNERLK